MARRGEDKVQTDGSGAPVNHESLGNALTNAGLIPAPEPEPAPEPAEVGPADLGPDDQRAETGDERDQSASDTRKGGAARGARR